MLKSKKDQANYIEISAKFTARFARPYNQQLQQQHQK